MWQAACCDSASFDLPADFLAECIREVEAAQRAAVQIGAAAKGRLYDGLGLRVSCWAHASMQDVHGLLHIAVQLVLMLQRCLAMPSSGACRAPGMLAQAGTLGTSTDKPDLAGDLAAAAEIPKRLESAIAAINPGPQGYTAPGALVRPGRLANRFRRRTQQGPGLGAEGRGRQAPGGEGVAGASPAGPAAGPHAADRLDHQWSWGRA